jgi:hypothetical protein
MQALGNVDHDRRGILYKGRNRSDEVAHTFTDAAGFGRTVSSRVRLNLLFVIHGALSNSCRKV